MLTYSRGPINSIPPSSRFFTGLTNLAIAVERNMPGKNLFLVEDLLVD
jgi:hypothetical protein